MIKKFYFLVLFAFLFLSCNKTTQTKLVFLDEYVLADSISFKNTIIGGLSGVDFANNQYYFVVDDAKNPRILSANISVSDNKIQAVIFNDVIFLADATTNFYQQNTLDLESVFVDEATNEFLEDIGDKTIEPFLVDFNPKCNKKQFKKICARP